MGRSTFWLSLVLGSAALAESASCIAEKSTARAAPISKARTESGLDMASPHFFLALSPARQAARLQALQARIRPHFLFNSINAVLAIVRADPKRALPIFDNGGNSGPLQRFQQRAEASVLKPA